MEPMVPFPLVPTLLLTTKTIIKKYKKTKMIFFENISLNNCLGLTQFPFVTLGTTLTYTTPNLNNSRNLIESNKCIDLTSCNNKDGHPHHGLPQDNGIIKSICLIRIRPNDNFLSHTRTSIRINNQ